MAHTRWTALRTSMWQAPSSSTGGPPMCMRRGLSTSWRKGPSISPSMFWYCSCGPSSRRQGPLGNLTWLADPAFDLMWATGAEKSCNNMIHCPRSNGPKSHTCTGFYMWNKMTPKEHKYVTCAAFFIVSSQWTVDLLLMVGYKDNA